MGKIILDELNKQVSSAISRAEELDRNRNNSIDAWLEVASLEDRISNHSLATNYEKNIARRGAVNAALKSSNYDLANSFVRNYISKHGISQNHQSELFLLLKRYKSKLNN